MSSYSQLYITEDVFETFNKEITEIFGEDWRLEEPPFDSGIKRIMHVDVLDSKFKKIGFIKIENKPAVVGDLLGDDTLGWEPEKILEIKKF